MRVDAGGPAADRHKLSGHRGRCGEARTGLTLTFRRRAVSLAAGRRCRSSPTSAAETVSASSRLRLSRPGIGRESCLHLPDHRFDRGGAAQALPAQRAQLGRESAQHLQAQPGGIGACSEALAGGFEACLGSTDPARRSAASMWRSPSPTEGAS